MKSSCDLSARWCALFALPALLAACATPVTQRIAVDSAARSQEERIQQRLVVQDLAKLEERLWTVGYGLLKAGVVDCGDTTRPSLGYMAFSRDRMPAASRELYTEALGLDQRLRVVAIYKGGAAEAAGMKVGDVIADPHSSAVSVPGESREAARQRLVGPVSVDIERTGEARPIALAMIPDTVCDYPLKVQLSTDTNAHADGKQIVVTKGMMRLATEDRDLALVIGHELGHNTMGHLGKKKQNAAVGLIFDILAAAARVKTQNAFMNAGASAFSQDFEAEADYVGLYYVARAGYDTKGAADFWRRMAVENPGSIKTNYSSSHPATTERFLAIEKVSQEIQDKEAAHTELIPNRTK